MFSVDDIQKPNPKENSFERSLVKKIKSMFPSCYEIPKPIRPSSTGTPDRQFLINGKFVAFETKRAKNSATRKKQIERIEAIINAGGFAGVVKSIEEGFDILHNAGLM